MCCRDIYPVSRRARSLRRRWPARTCAGAALLAAAGCLALLLSHSYTAAYTQEMTDAGTSAGGEVTVLCTYTVTTNNLRDERYLRWDRSAALWGARGEVLGEHAEWRGHGVKLNLLRERLRGMVDAGRGEELVMYTDSHDVMFAGPVREAAARFVRGGARVLFAASATCSPDEAQRSRYPRGPAPYPYLNAGALIGYAGTLHELVSQRAVGDEEDDQRYYTRAYLNRTLRERLAIRLDQRAEIFQCLANASEDVRVVSGAEGRAHLRNSVTGSRPLVLHGNGHSESAMWSLEAALVGAWLVRAPRTPATQELARLAELYGLSRDGADDAPDY